MPQDLALDLENRIQREAVHLRAVTEREAGVKPSAKAWSKKEELGHLIDSAANNHIRFVRGSFEPEFRGPGYEQDRWVSAHAYQEMSWTEIIDFWERYNQFLARLVRQIADDRLTTPCVVGQSAPVTLRFLIEDYTLHLQHHVDHILQREKITQYPGAAVGV